MSLGMGAGPGQLLAASLDDVLQRHGHEEEVERVSLDPQPNVVAA
jgi:hypothetical protein